MTPREISKLCDQKMFLLQRKKELEKLENEMLEASAEENRKSKEQHLTEIVKTLFLIYFRGLKKYPRLLLVTTLIHSRK